MAEIAEAMKTASSISIGVDIKMYSKKGGGLIYKSNASLIKSEESTKSVLAEMEFVNTPLYEVRVDHEERAVLIFKKEKPSDTNLPETEQVEFDVEALKKLIESEESTTKKPTIKLVSSVGGIKKYSIKGSPGISELILELDLTNKKIKSVLIEYGDASSKGQYVVLRYSTFTYNTDVTSVFNLTNYFTEKDNNYVLSPKLKGYHIYTEL
ncbi:MAG: hypothetical protein HRT58_22020 [Crocinitomicaceae bacterium]|nr:hypothetical protein [Flavobacteriales bacterium]NQZ38353.1 hypothetical protein [Crocinitomicaceae bacterium]